MAGKKGPARSAPSSRSSLCPAGVFFLNECGKRVCTQSPATNTHAEPYQGYSEIRITNPAFISDFVQIVVGRVTAVAVTPQFASGSRSLLFTRYSGGKIRRANTQVYLLGNLQPRYLRYAPDEILNHDFNPRRIGIALVCVRRFAKSEILCGSAFSSSRYVAKDTRRTVI